MKIGPHWPNVLSKIKGIVFLLAHPVAITSKPEETTTVIATTTEQTTAQLTTTTDKTTTVEPTTAARSTTTLIATSPRRPANPLCYQNVSLMMKLCT